MTNPWQSKEYHERNLLELYRAIQKLNKPNLLSSADVGDVLEAYEETIKFYDERDDVIDFDTESYQLGFVTGLAAITHRNIQQQEALEDFQYGVAPQYTPPAEVGTVEYIGGPTGGVVKGQGEDPKLVEQSGVHKGQNDE